MLNALSNSTHVHVHERTAQHTKKHTAQPWMCVCTHIHACIFSNAHSDLIMVNALFNPPIQHQSVTESGADSAMLAGIRLGERTTGTGVN